MHTSNSDQTGQMPRLIRVFPGHAGDFVGFVMLRLICHSDSSHESRSHDLVNKRQKSRLMTKPTKWHMRPPSLIRIFAVRMKKAWVLSYPLSARQRL